jgi:hypothetical protein
VLIVCLLCVKARNKKSGATVAIKQILEDETMMNRETEILKTVASHPNKINLYENFYTKSAALAPGESQSDALPVAADKQYLNLVTDFMPMTLSKYN